MLLVPVILHLKERDVGVLCDEHLLKGLVIKWLHMPLNWSSLQEMLALCSNGGSDREHSLCSGN